MRKFALVCVAFAAAAAFGQHPAQAYYGTGAWCAVQSIGPGVTERCYFNDIESCRLEVIAGNRGFCTTNPYVSGAAAAAVDRKARKRVRY
jgi:hypothetical protein